MSPTTPRIAWLPWALLALGAVGVLYGMVGFWMRGYDSFDRAIIIIASAAIIWQRHSQLIAIPDRPKPLLGCVLLALGALAFFPPWFVFAQIGSRPVILWWESLALFVAAVGLILIRSGPNLLRTVAFPLIFPLFALPLPGRILGPLQEFLQGIAASIAAEAIPFFGVPLSREGFTFLLPHGRIGIVEACSGLTQVRAILSVAAFIAYWRGFGLIRSALTVLFGIPIIVVLNSIRVTLSGLIAEWAGYEYIEGIWHELLGLALFVVGLSFVLGITRLMMRPTDTNDYAFEGTVPQPRRGATAFATMLLAASAIAGIAAILVPNFNRSAGQAPNFTAIPANLGAWKQFSVDNPPRSEGSQEATYEGVKNTLTFNEGLHRIYAPGGLDYFEKADVWLLYWKSSMVVKDYHHPDVCYINRGDKMVARSVEPVTTPGGRRIDMTYREFTHGDSYTRVVYWTQEGRRIWTEKDEAVAASFVFPFVWIRERLATPRSADQCDDRLVMMVGMPMFKNDSSSKQIAKLLDFAGRLADEVYTICPWADPK